MKRSEAGQPLVKLPAVLGALAFAMALLGTGIARAVESDANPATTLRTKYDIVRGELGNSPFQRPLALDSSESSSSVAGEIHALIQSPFATLSAVLNSPDNWCSIMMLHLNTKYCRASTINQQSMLNVSIGKKYDQPLDDAYPVAFAYRVTAKTPAYLRVQLSADEGPLSTRDYRIVLEAIPLESGQTFMHLSYSYSYGLLGRLAMQTYLATIGRNKVGFTVTGKQANGEVQRIGGMRGVVERNTMRYYLAFDAYLGALVLPPEARLEKSLRDWYAGIERYPRQLHEMEQGEYLAMKRKEFLRLQTSASPRAKG
jgi:hypothetical protein